MYYILEWMLASSIPHVDGACIKLPYFDIALYIIFVRLLRLSIFKIKEIFFIIYMDNCKLYAFEMHVSNKSGIYLILEFI